jgi:hypothetical protein
MNPVREEWKDNKVSWTPAVFSTLEHFVESKNKETIEAIVETEDVSSLNSRLTRSPDPIPSKKHKNYVLDYAEFYLDERY